MSNVLKLLIEGSIDTLLMVIISLVLAYIFGLLIGIVLILTKSGGLMQAPRLHQILSSIINIMRSIPFIILMVLLIPFTRFVVGTSIGVSGTIVPLFISATPFVARMIEASLEEIDQLTIDTVRVFGASKFEIIWNVYLKESIPSLVRQVPIVAIALIGYSAMAGATGGGGLGDIAIRYGYYNYDTSMMLYTILIIIVIVEMFQIIFTTLAKKIDKKQRRKT
ncbi:MAG: methionine ABC transporter permease [Candidatus Izemoplasmatales bacterium]